MPRVGLESVRTVVGWPDTDGRLDQVHLDPASNLASLSNIVAGLDSDVRKDIRESLLEGRNAQGAIGICKARLGHTLPSGGVSVGAPNALGKRSWVIRNKHDSFA
jgi:hypothetical protein